MSDVLYTPVFEANKRAYESKRFRVISNEGSTRSSKTVSLSQLLALYIPNISKESISIVSPSLPHLKRGARRDFLNALQQAGAYDDNAFNKTDNIYNFDNGSYVEFFGVEDGGKVHGPGRDILWVNEANLISFDIYKQLAIRTNKIIFLDYNPADEYSWVYGVTDSPGNKKIHSTYRNNLGNLSAEIIAEIESLKDADENAWKVYGLGLRGTSSETIYTHWKTCSGLPGKGEQFFGLDFGFNNQTALVLCECHEGRIYVDEWLYQTKLTTSDLMDEFAVLGVRHGLEIFADCAEPKTIEEISRAGYNIHPSDKDVLEGIRKVRSMPLYVTERSTSIIKELRSYKWKKDKNDKVLDEPVKFNDHALDAIRYAVFTKLTSDGRTWTAF
jgi:phage terminase large subunit